LTIALQGEVTASRFELRTTGFVEYFLFDETAIVTHTEVQTGHEGRGLGSELVRDALDYFRSQKKHVVPVCGFFAHQMRRNPRYADLLAPGCRRIFSI
jgi:predicted GNAT family acetyltransferase